MFRLVPARIDDALRIVSIGGGTGLSSLLHGLKQHMHCGKVAGRHHHDLDITAVVTVTDDGGSSGRLRRDFDMLPPGDIRSCLVAMSEDEALLARLFQYRFSSGKGLKGHTLGNLFLTALTDLSGGDFPRAVQQAAEVLASCGRIYPSTAAKVVLEAELADGTRVEGETRISRSRARIKRVRLKPRRPAPMTETLKAIAEADVITLGPGSLFTSVIPNLLVKGIPEAIAASPAVKLSIVNLMWQPGETIQFTAADHVEAINLHARRRIVDVAAVNTRPIPARLRQRYAQQEASPVLNDLDRLAAMGVRIVARELAAVGEKVRHDPAAVADLTIGLAAEARLARTQPMSA
jgi:uncharacterized cofD-like protein